MNENVDLAITSFPVTPRIHEHNARNTWSGNLQNLNQPLWTCYKQSSADLITRRLRNNIHRLIRNHSQLLKPFHSVLFTSSLNMELHRVLIATRIILFILSAGSACEINQCFCAKNEPTIICGLDDAATPLFTMDEKLFTTKIILTHTQYQMISDICNMFPSLAELFYTGDTCPTPITCASIQCL